MDRALTIARAENYPYRVTFVLAMLGGINTTLNPLYTAEEAAHQLSDAGAKFLVTAPKFADKAQEAAQQAKIKELFVFGEAEGTTPFDSLLESDGDVPRAEITKARLDVQVPWPRRSM